MSSTMSQAAAFPAHVLTWSAKCMKRSAIIASSYGQKKAPRGTAAWCPFPGWASGLLGRRRPALLPEVPVVGHAAVHVVVHVPLDRALGEHALRLHDLLEQGVLGRLL